jgi:hypothetical protein
MNTTRRNWMLLILSLPLIGKFSGQSFATQNNSQENDFLMNRFYIAGFQFYDGPRLAGKMRTGEPLSLATEVDNTHDRFAVKIE